MAVNAEVIAELVSESSKVTENISSSSDTLSAVKELSNQTVVDFHICAPCFVIYILQ